MKGEGWLTKGKERLKIKWSEKMIGDPATTAEKIVKLLRKEQMSSLDDLKALAFCTLAIIGACPSEDRDQLFKDMLAELQRAYSEEHR